MSEPDGEPAYFRIRGGDIHRTVQFSGAILVDVDGSSRILGVETLDGTGWEQALAVMAMAGWLKVDEKMVTGT